MTANKAIVTFIIAVIQLLSAQLSHSCSAYKITASGKTMVGSNYDTWLLTPRIWFETNGYGTAFTGSRVNGEFGFAPQTAMNEFGLAFVTLATATPTNGTSSPGKKQISSRTNYLKDILHTCKTVDDVKAYIEQYDHSSLCNDVFLYVDKTGKYLVVEPYLMTLGNDPNYVLANFCPSTITDFSTIKQVRYINGTQFLKNKIDTSLAFCTALSDTMHVCRKKLGDGTLLTSILDLKEGITYLYFYHDYMHLVKFNLREELAKGNHFIEIVSLFPANEEFKKLNDFKTPANSIFLNLLMEFYAALFFISAFFFLISYFIKRNTTKYLYLKLLLVPLNLVMLAYVFVLVRIENIYYFPAPYTDGSFSIVSVASYIPFLVLVLFIPLLIMNRKVFTDSGWSFFPKWLFTLNNVAYLTMLILFVYWGLFNIFN